MWVCVCVCVGGVIGKGKTEEGEEGKGVGECFMLHAHMKYDIILCLISDQ